ncbi:hypothetical protein [Aeromonas hydrophila]|uniref:hypothetical protein n=1 Tax=Aeromonas hydrophila TaxID=644 RepID=UPI003EC4B430
MNPTHSPRLAELLAQLAVLLEETDLSPLDRHRYGRLLDALYLEVPGGGDPQGGTAMISFAWAAHGSEPAFVGPINQHTGKRSQAGSLSAFVWRSDRDKFIEQTRGGAIAVTAKQARELKAGLTEQAFNELVAVLTGGNL